MSEKKVFNAWYSAACDRLYGHVVYRDKDGVELKVTEVASDSNTPSGKWNDAIFLGEVVTWVRSNRRTIEHSAEAVSKLHSELTSLITEQNRCQKQFAETGNCFCFTCPIKRKPN